MRNRTETKEYTPQSASRLFNDLFENYLQNNNLVIFEQWINIVKNSNVLILFPACLPSTISELRQLQKLLKKNSQNNIGISINNDYQGIRTFENWVDRIHQTNDLAILIHGVLVIAFLIKNYSNYRLYKNELQQSIKRLLSIYSELSPY